ASIAAGRRCGRLPRACSGCCPTAASRMPTASSPATARCSSGRTGPRRRWGRRCTPAAATSSPCATAWCCARPPTSRRRAVEQLESPAGEGLGHLARPQARLAVPDRLTLDLDQSSSWGGGGGQERLLGVQEVAQRERALLGLEQLQDQRPR